MGAGNRTNNRTTVLIDNDEYLFRGEEPAAYLQSLGVIVDGYLQKLRKVHPNLARHRLAILAGMYLADELEKAKKENAELLQTLREAR